MCRGFKGRFRALLFEILTSIWGLEERCMLNPLMIYLESYISPLFPALKFCRLNKAEAQSHGSPWDLEGQRRFQWLWMIHALTLLLNSVFEGGPLHCHHGLVMTSWSKVLFCRIFALSDHKTEQRCSPDQKHTFCFTTTAADCPILFATQAHNSHLADESITSMWSEHIRQILLRQVHAFLDHE